MNIYVGNLSRKAVESQLKDLFGEFGEVKSAKIIIDRETGESKGFAFLEMPDQISASAAISALDAKEVDGRRLTVNEAKPRAPRSFNNFSSNYGYKTRNDY